LEPGAVISSTQQQVPREGSADLPTASHPDLIKGHL